MWDKNKHKEAARSIFMSSMFWFANVAAAVATFFSVQPAYRFTIGWVQDFARHQYGPDWIEPVSWFWWLAVALILFFTARASIATLIVMGALAIAVRLI